MKTTFNMTVAVIATIFTIATSASAQVSGNFGGFQSNEIQQFQTQPQIELTPPYTYAQGNAAQPQAIQQEYYVPPVEVVPPTCDYLPKLEFDGREIHGVGMQVVQVKRGGVAEQIGLEAGDIIVRIDGRRISCVNDYKNALARAAMYGNGHVDLVVRNIRYRPGCTVNREFVSLHADLPQRCFMPTPSVVAGL